MNQLTARASRVGNSTGSGQKEVEPERHNPETTGDDHYETIAKSIEPLRTLGSVSAILTIPVFKLRRAAKAGAFSVYRIGNRRMLVRLSEVLAAIEASKNGG